MRKLNSAKTPAVMIYSLIFLLMLWCNFYTTYLADDYQYALSFATMKKLTGLRDIIPSMIAHTKLMNGRIVAHTIVQLFMLLPKGVFNVFNALMFALLIYLVYRIGKGERRNNYIIVGMFSALWYYTPAFGHVYLWMDGSCNYLWSVVFTLTFMLPYVDSYLYDRQLAGVKRWLFPVLAFMAGAYSENASSAAIGMVGLLQLIEVFQQKKKLDVYKVLCMVIAIVGYLTIYMAPAQWMNKKAEMTADVLLNNISTAVSRYATLMPLLSICAVLMVLNVVSKADNKRILLAAVLLIGSLFANFIMIVAWEYPERSQLSVCVYLVAAIAVLMHNLSGNYKTVCASFVACLLVITSFQVGVGLVDIKITHKQLRANEIYLETCAQQGIMDVEIPNLRSATKYSALYYQRYIVEDPTTWPNVRMAEYYGLNNIYGK